MFVVVLCRRALSLDIHFDSFSHARESLYDDTRSPYPLSLSLPLPLPLPLPLSFSRHTRRYVPLVVAVTKGNAPGSRTEGFFATNLCGDALVPSAARVVAAQFNLTREAGSYNVVPTTAYPHEGRCVRNTAFYFYYLLKYVRFTEMIHSHNAYSHTGISSASSPAEERVFVRYRS